MTPLVSISRDLCEQVEQLAFAVRSVRLQPARLRPGAARGLPRALGLEEPARGADDRDEPGPVRHGADRCPVRRRGDGARLRRDHGPVGKPPREHPARPIAGFDCHRSEVSGTRFWGWARDRFGTAERFFDRVFVANWCPLVFMDESGRNRTPDRAACGRARAALSSVRRGAREDRRTLRPSLVIGVGGFAEKRAREALGTTATIGSILHPSPASPAANRDWAGLAERQLARSSASYRPGSVGPMRRPSTVELMLLDDGSPVGAQPERDEVHPHERAAPAPVRDRPLRPRRRHLRRPHALRRAVAPRRTAPPAYPRARGGVALRSTSSRSSSRST